MAARRRRERRQRRARAREQRREPPRVPARPVSYRRRGLLLGALVALVGSACLGARALRSTSLAAESPADSVAAVAAVTVDEGAVATPAADPAPAREPAASPGLTSATAGDDAPELAYAGRDERRQPRYVARAFTDEERDLLRRAFGIADPNRLWLPDSSPGAVLRYDAADGLAARVGYRSMRRPGETWEAFARRIAALPTRAWPAVARRSYHTGLAALDPEAREQFAALVDAARAAGFRVRVAETYRAPERQAFILARGNGQTFTATSPHAYGRAADILVGDGRIDRPHKVREWIRFRRWVLDWGAGRFRLVGAASRTWDWPHVELADAPIGFRTVDVLLAAARRCLAVPAASDEPADDPCALPRDPERRAAMLAAALADATLPADAAGAAGAR